MENVTWIGGIDILDQAIPVLEQRTRARPYLQVPPAGQFDRFERFRGLRFWRRDRFRFASSAVVLVEAQR